MKKFQDINVLEVLERIMKTNTAYYQSDFEKDISTLKKAAESKNPADKKWLWMSRPAGTWCLRECEVYLKDSPAYCIWNHYGECAGKILAYAVELKKHGQEKIIGDLYQLDYRKHYLHVMDTALPIGSITLTYEHGSLEQTGIGHTLPRYDEQLGELQHCEYQPKEPGLLQYVLEKEHGNRQRNSRDGDITLHIGRLSGRKGIA